LVFVLFDCYSQLTKELIIKYEDTSYLDFMLPTSWGDKHLETKYFDISGEKKYVRPKYVDEVLLFDEVNTVRMTSHVDPIIVRCKL